MSGKRPASAMAGDTNREQTSPHIRQPALLPNVSQGFNPINAPRERGTTIQSPKRLRAGSPQLPHNGHVTQTVTPHEGYVTQTMAPHEGYAAQTVTAHEGHVTQTVTPLLVCLPKEGQSQSVASPRNLPSETSSSPKTVSHDGGSTQTLTPPTSLNLAYNQQQLIIHPNQLRPMRASVIPLPSIEHVLPEPMNKPDHTFGIGHRQYLVNEKKEIMRGFNCALPPIWENRRLEVQPDRSLALVSPDYHIGPQIKPLWPLAAERVAVEQQRVLHHQISRHRQWEM